MPINTAVKVNEVFGRRLQHLRKTRQPCATLEQIGLITGLTKQAVQRWEAGVNLPSLERLIILANFYGVSLDYLAGRVDDPTGHAATTPHPVLPNQYNSNHLTVAHRKTKVAETNVRRAIEALEAIENALFDAEGFMQVNLSVETLSTLQGGNENGHI